MKTVQREIKKEDYEKAKEQGASALVSDYLKMAYGACGARVWEDNGSYYLTFDMAESCD